MSIIWTIYADEGGCRHAASLADAQITSTGRLNWISQPICVAGLTTGKISVACLNLRLQPPTRWRTNLLVGLCTLMVCVNTTLVILMFTQCIPVNRLWSPPSLVADGHCFNPDVISIVTQAGSSYMAFMDLVLAAIPVHMIWSLQQMDKKKKLAICGLLSTGWTYATPSTSILLSGTPIYDVLSRAFGFAIVKTIQLENVANRDDITCKLTSAPFFSSLQGV